MRGRSFGDPNWGIRKWNRGASAVRLHSAEVAGTGRGGVKSDDEAVVAGMKEPSSAYGSKQLVECPT
jgi:hypothetical protein